MPFGIGAGPTAQEEGQYGALDQSTKFATDLGEKNSLASSDFMRSVLSGDSTKISQTLAPQIGAAKTSAQQQNKTNTQFGTRSGGTAASSNAANDKVHSDITDLIGSFTGSSVSGLASSGDSLLAKGMTGQQALFGEAEKLHAEKKAKTDGLINDIGKTAAIAAAPFTGGASLLALKAANGTDSSADDQSLGGFKGFTKMGG